MPEEKKIDIWDCQEWIRTAPIDDVREFIGWAKAIAETRAEMATKRKRRSDAGTVRAATTAISGQQPIGLKDLKEIAK